jgi:hypothetical protein
MPEDETAAQFAVVWPSGPRRTHDFRPAARSADLNGRTIAFVWDYIFRGDEMWEVIQRELAARFPDVRFVGYEGFGNIHSTEEREVLAALPGRLRDLDVATAIVGVAA